MKAKVESQKLLLDLNSIDQSISKLDYQKKNHPQLMKITELTARVPSIEASIVENDSQITETKKEVSKAEIDVENISKRVQKDKERLSSSETKAKDLTQIQHEIGTLESKQKELEEVQIEFLEKVEDLEYKKRGLQEILEQVKAEISELNTSIKADFERANKEISNFATERQIVVGKIENELIALYEKIRIESGNGAGLFMEGVCKSCQIIISPSEIHLIEVSDPEEVLRCENCRCIMVRKSNK
jgi:predicted  nucleic acid-binding Zn-ribbon protein